MPKSNNYKIWPRQKLGRNSTLQNTYMIQLNEQVTADSEMGNQFPGNLHLEMLVLLFEYCLGIYFAHTGVCCNYSFLQLQPFVLHDFLVTKAPTVIGDGKHPEEGAEKPLFKTLPVLHSNLLTNILFQLASEFS